MTQPWPRARVDEAAPDEQVRRAGLKLAVPTPWSDVGTQGQLLWGRCRGSGSKPYQVSVELSSGASKCSCPSRKFPCKHAMALLYLWSDGHVFETGIADFAAEWQANRQARTAGRKATDGPRTPERESAAAARGQQRGERIDAGLVELDRWLDDQLRQGLAAGAANRDTQLRELAARMVDAQAPGVAARLLELSRVGDQSPDWAARLLDGFGLLHLLVRGWQRRTELDDEWVATLREHIGFTRRRDELLALPGVTDRWAVVGLRDAQEERVSVRRVWLVGQETGRFAQVLFFAVGRAEIESNLYPGTALRATLHFHPGRGNLRATVGEREVDALPLDGLQLDVVNIARVRELWRAALALDPWCARWPVAVKGRLRLSPQAAQFGDDDVLPLRGGRELTRALAARTLGRPCTLLAEVDDDGLHPFGLLDEGRVVTL